MTTLLAVAVIVSILAHYAYETVQARKFAAERKAWTEERRELLNRIQRPEHIPVVSQSDFQVPEREPDEWAQVGQIVIDDKYGLDDD